MISLSLLLNLKNGNGELWMDNELTINDVSWTFLCWFPWNPWRRKSSTHACHAYQSGNPGGYSELWSIEEHSRNLQNTRGIPAHLECFFWSDEYTGNLERDERHLNEWENTTDLSFRGIIGNPVNIETVGCIIRNVEECDTSTLRLLLLIHVSRRITRRWIIRWHTLIRWTWIVHHTIVHLS